MRKTLQLTIPNACHESWQAMTPVENGRYCMSCRKNVMDFTNMSDREILNYISNAQGTVCGRLHSDQLNRAMTYQKERKISWLKYFLKFTLPAFFVTAKAEAQDCKKPVIVQSPVKQAQPDIIKIVGNAPLERDAFIVKGLITDERGQPVPGASVMVRGTNRGTTTDAEGYYQMTFSDGGEVVIEISSVGFQSQEIVVMPALSPSVTGTKLTVVTLTEMSFVFAGAIVTTEHRSSKKTKRSPIEIARTIITADSVRVYPNPVGQGNNLEVELKINQPGIYSVEVTDFNGRLMMRKELNAEAKLSRSTISTNQLLAGRYIVCVRNKQGKKIGVKKIIVQ